MKQVNILISTIALCTGALFISCSANEDDYVTSQSQEKEGFTTITVGAPTIEPDGTGNTRVAFAYDNGLTMGWQTGDQIRITPSNVEAQKYTATNISADGKTATFTGAAFSGPVAPYTITIGSTYSGDPETETKAEIADFENKTIETTQTQTGNNTTAHLHRNYSALLDGVNTIENITFSQAWATAHENSTGNGVFKQSACLKFDLTVPTNTGGNKNITRLYGIRIRVYSSSNLTGLQSIFPTKNDGTSPVSVLVLNINDETPTITNNKTNIIGYFMLPATTITLPANNYLVIDVATDGAVGGSKVHYLRRILEIGTSDKTIEQGKLGIIKLNSNGWS